MKRNSTSITDKKIYCAASKAYRAIYLLKSWLLILIALLFFAVQASSQTKLKIATSQFPVSGDIKENSN
jgi:hypothetical protein